MLLPLFISYDPKIAVATSASGNVDFWKASVKERKSLIAISSFEFFHFTTLILPLFLSFILLEFEFSLFVLNAFVLDQFGFTSFMFDSFEFASFLECSNAILLFNLCCSCFENQMTFLYMN